MIESPSDGNPFKEPDMNIRRADDADVGDFSRGIPRATVRRSGPAAPRPHKVATSSLEMRPKCSLVAVSFREPVTPAAHLCPGVRLSFGAAQPPELERVACEGVFFRRLPRARLCASERFSDFARPGDNPESRPGSGGPGCLMIFAIARKL